MRKRGSAPLGLLLLYVLALLQPAVQPAPPLAAAPCPIGLCGAPSVDVVSSAAASTATLGLRGVDFATALLRVRTQHTDIGGLDPLSLAESLTRSTRASIAAEEHSALRTAFHRASTGARAAPPRAPPSIGNG